MAAAPASAAVSRAQAAKAAVTALGVKKTKQPVLVLGDRRPIPAGSRIADIRPAPARGNGKVRTALLLRASAGERHWMFFADFAPFSQFEHPGKVVLVGQRTGTVVVSKRTRFAPIVEGVTPAFLQTTTGYAAQRNRVFYRPWTAAATATIAPQTVASRIATGPAATQFARQLAAQRSCIVLIPGAVGRTTSSELAGRNAAAVATYFRSLAALAPGTTVRRYWPTLGASPTAFVSKVIRQDGCRNVLLYVTGIGLASSDPQVLLRVTNGPVEISKVRELRASALRGVLRANRGVGVSLVIDASHAGRFGAVLGRESNFTGFLAPRGLRGTAFGHLPEVKRGSRLVRNVGNPDRLGEFTNSFLRGLNAFSTSQAEVAHAVGATDTSLLAFAAGRSDALGSSSSFAGYLGASKTVANEIDPSTAPPTTDPTPVPPAKPNAAPTANAVAVTTDEDTSASITFAGADADGDALTYELVTIPDHGTVSGTGTTRTYTPAADYNGTDTFTYRVVDPAGAASAPATASISVSPVVDAPRLTTDAAASFTEALPPVVVTPGATVVDPDPTGITGATLTISANFDGVNDRLAFVNGGGIVGSWNQAAGVLTLTGAATAAQYQAAIRTVTFDNQWQNPSTLPRTIDTVVTGTNGLTSSDSTQVSITAVNDRPVLTTFAGPPTYVEQAAPINANNGVTAFDNDDADLEGATIMISAATLRTGDVLTHVDGNGITATAFDTATGTLTLSGTSSKANYFTALRAIKFSSTSDDPGTTRSLDWVVTDGDLSSVALPTTITITPVNDAPVVTTTATALDFTENDPATAVDADLTVVDPDSPLVAARATIAAGFAAAQDSLAWVDNDLTDTITLSAATASDLTFTGSGTAAQYQAALRAVTFSNSSESPSATARVVRFTASDAVSTSANADRPITVTSVDDPAVAVADAYSVPHDAIATEIPVRLNDTDVDGGTTTISSVVQPANGVVVITGGGTGLTYQPTAAYCNDGSPLDTFTYTLTPGGGTATVSMTVLCNTAPVAVDDAISANDAAVGNTQLVVNSPEDGAPSVALPHKTVSGNILSNDTDTELQTLRAVPGSIPTNQGGSVLLEADGDFTYTNPAGCSTTTDYFDYTVTDNSATSTGAGTDTGRVLIQRRGCVWYVDNQALPAGNGSSMLPFRTLAAANAVATTNHATYVYRGDGTSTGLTTTTALSAYESLNGEAAPLIYDADGVGVTPAFQLAAGTGQYPMLSLTSAAATTGTAAGMAVRGLQIDWSGATAPISLGAGTMTLEDVRLIDAGTAATLYAVNQAGGTLTASDLVVDSQHSGVALNGGSSTFASAGTISVTSVQRALVANAHTFIGGAVFDTLITSAATGGGILVTGGSGAVTLGTSVLSVTSSGTGAALEIGSGPVVTIPASGTSTLSSTGGPALSATLLSTGTALDIDSASSLNSTGSGLVFNSITNARVSIAAGSISGFASFGATISGGGTGNFTYNGTIGDGTGQSVSVTGRTLGSTTTFGGAITDGIDASGGISIATVPGAVVFGGPININTGPTTSGTEGISISTITGTVTFAAAVTITSIGNVNAVYLATVSGLVRFDGLLTTSTEGIAASNGSGILAQTGGVNLTLAGGFHATASGTGYALTQFTGTLNITGSDNIVSTTQRDAVYLARTNLGSDGVTFQSISSGTATVGSGTFGLALIDIPAGGFFRVTGKGGPARAPRRVPAE